MAQYFKTFRKELKEITYVEGYEHSCQLHMEDIQAHVDDDYLSSSLRKQKEPVPFVSMPSLFDREQLGGQPS
ncbi:hypothetical protein [Flagellimonas baculiformis]|uniref:hypothetical protein n=1 Tax=Flagellimonas baculiformis TaxID=3067310 RepID=UPI00296E9EEF|nr:hypothetical protein [Muricauda sp. D6]